MRKYKIIIALQLVVIIICVTKIGLVTKTPPVENFPPLKVNEENKIKVNEARQKYKDVGYNDQVWIEDYTAFGDYLTFGVNKPHTYRNIDKSMQLDENGIPKVYYNDDYYYNPVTTAQYALTKYGQFIRGDKESKEKFIYAADFLITLADDGAYRNKFPFKYYVTGKHFESGWVSGLAQGQALSVYARAYHLTKDKKYLNAGNKAFDFLITPVAKGGTLATLESLDPSLKHYIIFDEYPIVPATHTLNGFIFSMLGVYDWWQVEPNKHKKAERYFKESVKTLKVILPYYDAGGFPTYDLAFITHDIKPTYNVGYQVFHVSLLNAIYSITKDPYFDFVKGVWSSYVE